MGQEALVAVLANPKNILDPDTHQQEPECHTTGDQKRHAKAQPLLKTNTKKYVL
jgi:hypothetical protein